MPPGKAGAWWRVLLTCRAVDRRWALRHVSGIDGRFPALAIEHRNARREDRAPDVEVDPIRSGPWWRYLLLTLRLAATVAVTTVWTLGAVTVIMFALSLLGVVEVQVSSR